MDCPWTVGAVQHLEPGVRMVLAPNPSPMTHWGTNSFIVGEGDVTVIDPGPEDTAHLAALLRALHPSERVARIIVTHAHRDHSGLARSLAAATGAPILAFGPASSGRSPRMRDMRVHSGEGIDTHFTPDEVIAEGDVLTNGGAGLTVLHTPGHMGGHLCLALNDRLFTGDHVMGWAPSLVSPPEGDMTDYMSSLERLSAGPWRKGYPAHGLPIEDLTGRCDFLLQHRRSRESAILAALDMPADLETLQSRVYADVPAQLQPAARRNLLAHLIDLVHKGQILVDGHDLNQARFSRP